MRYCSQCVLPDTRPNLKIMEDGICNACHAWIDKKQDINWNEREQEFKMLADNIKQRAHSWDCVIPVSGGKDSTWQVIKALEYGLKPLCVTWRTPARNQLGQKNLDNLIHLGVDHMDVSINPHIEKLFTLKSFKKVGSLALPMHMALFAIPLRIAVNYKIPLVLWGENSGMEYGGNESALLGFKMTRSWLKTYGVTQGTVAADWIDDELTKKDLSIYEWPTDEELENAGVTATFLGWYFAWDPTQTYQIAKAHGFQAIADKPKTGFYQFADVDDEFIISIHHWLKWYKFGFTRLWDNLALEIRSGRMQREQALKIIKENGNENPTDAINSFCHWANLKVDEFYQMIEIFRNKSIWTKELDDWKIKNFLIPEWSWS